MVFDWASYMLDRLLWDWYAEFIRYIGRRLLRYSKQEVNLAGLERE